MIKPQTLKGFRDFLPSEARKRAYVLNILKGVFESFGFEPLETPALEYEEVLLGKYGEEGDKLMYRFTDNGDRRVALRYDQTVPLARVVAEYPEIPKPFKRYQMQNVWRAENTQKGRFREFLQCDIDIIGLNSINADAEIIAVVDKSLKSLGFDKYEIKINDRKLLFEKIKTAGVADETLAIKAIREIDKIDKIGWQKLTENLLDLGLSKEIVTRLDTELSITQPIEQDPFLDPTIEAAKKLGVDSTITRKLYLARGLDYYTGMILEVKIEGYEAGSVGGGGRYDNLVGMFEKESIPAVGFAFGFDRLIEAMEELDLFPTDLSTTKVLVSIFSKELEEKSLEIASKLRESNINTEIWLESDSKLEKQLKYADAKGIPYVSIIGPDEKKNNTITLKNLDQQSQETLTLEALIQKLS